LRVCKWSGSYCCTVSRGFVSGVVRTVVLLVEGLSVELFVLLH
jgi:hypothetical protein